MVETTYVRSVRFADLAAKTIKFVVFCDVTPCSMVKVNGRFGASCSLCRRGRYCWRQDCVFSHP